MIRFHILRGLAALIVAAPLLTAAQPGPGGPPPGAPPGPPPGAPPGMPPGMPPSEPVNYHAAFEVKDGVLQPASADARVSGPKPGAASASGLRIESKADLVNGVLVQGRSDYALTDAHIELAGRGKSDFDGIAAGVLAKDAAKLTVRGAAITTRGVVSTAVTATGQATLHVQRSTLVAHGGPLPSGYVRRIGPGMMEPPTPLGLTGTARTVLVMGSAHAVFEDSTIEARGWGALSTDAARGALLEARRCKVIVHQVGYGTYADNGATVRISDSTIDSGGVAGIIAGQAEIAFDGVRARTDGNGVMIHSVMGQPSEVARLTIRGGELRSTNAAILVKSANAEITLDRARVEPVNGDLLLGVVNDDSFATKVNGQAVAGIHATVRASQLKGNLIHLDTDRAMRVDLIGSTLQGAVKGATLSLDEASRWTATADSTLMLAAPTRLAQIDAPAGVTIEAMADASVASPGRHALRSGGTLVVK